MKGIEFEDTEMTLQSATSRLFFDLSVSDLYENKAQYENKDCFRATKLSIL